MTPKAALIYTICFALFIALVILYLWIDDLLRVKWLKNLRNGDNVRFHFSGKWRRGYIVKKVDTGAVIHSYDNGRNYAVQNYNLKRYRQKQRVPGTLKAVVLFTVAALN